MGWIWAWKILPFRERDRFLGMSFMNRKIYIIYLIYIGIASWWFNSYLLFFRSALIFSLDSFFYSGVVPWWVNFSNYLSCLFSPLGFVFHHNIGFLSHKFLIFMTVADRWIFYLMIFSSSETTHFHISIFSIIY